MARRNSLKQAIDEARKRSKVEQGDMWVIRLSMPVTDVFCEATRPNVDGSSMTKDDVREDVGFIAAMFAQGIRVTIHDTDNELIRLVRSDKPWELVCLREEFMPPVMRALRRNGIHGRYYKSGTFIHYEF